MSCFAGNALPHAAQIRPFAALITGFRGRPMLAVGAAIDTVFSSAKIARLSPEHEHDRKFRTTLLAHEHEGDRT